MKNYYRYALRQLKLLIDNFKIKHDNEEFLTVFSNIENGIVFKETNLWILIFAILIASLGLNINSVAVIIGAMLISPLMGPIIGIGASLAIKDLTMLRQALKSYMFAALVGLVTSSIYFLISPFNDAHSEMLSRISPNIFDVLIAVFGGFAGMIATSSKRKGFVLHGVAIATALMPPLCIAGYGIATWQLNFFFGAFYLFIINTVFIAWATFITGRMLKFPTKKLIDTAAENRANRTIWFIVIVTLIPSIYYGYDLVQQHKFTSNASAFIEHEANIHENYLLSKNIDYDNHTVTLVYGGRKITKEEIDTLQKELVKYHLDQTNLVVKQGFSALRKSDNDEQIVQFSNVIQSLENQIEYLNMKLDSLMTDTTMVDSTIILGK